MVVQLIEMVNVLRSVVVQLIAMVAVTLLRYVHRHTNTKGGYSRYTLNDDDDDDDDDCSKLTRKYISTRKEEAGTRSSPASHLLPKSDKSVKFLGTLRIASHRETQIHQSQVRKYFSAKNKYIKFRFR